MSATNQSNLLFTEILIQANPAQVWEVLTHFDAYPDWNPFIASVKGPVEKGRTITVHITPPGASAMTFTPTVLQFEKNKEFRWRGKLLIPGLFDGEHSFTLLDNGNGTTTFLHREQFSGLLFPLFRKMMHTNTRRGFEAMNQKLKELLEKG